MVRINLKTGDIIKKQEFKGGSPEKKLQEFVEKHLNSFLGCHLLKSLYRIPDGQIDTLAVTEDGFPCIIEYKHKKQDTIINQIIFYYDWLQQGLTEFEFEKLIKDNEVTKDLAIDWTKIRLICIAKEYSKWDISLIKHLDTDIECYTYNYHKDELEVHLDPHIQYQKQSYGKKTSLGKEVTLEDHRNRAKEKGKELLDKLRKKVFKLGNDIKEGFTPNYIKYFINTTFLGVHVRQKSLTIQLRVNEETFTDPKTLAKDISNRKWSVTREMKISKEEELEYAISLIKQAYDYQH